MEKVVSCVRSLASNPSYWLSLIIVLLPPGLAQGIAIVLAAIMYEVVFATGHWTAPCNGY